MIYLEYKVGGRLERQTIEGVEPDSVLFVDDAGREIRIRGKYKGLEIAAVEGLLVIQQTGGHPLALEAKPY